MNDADRIYRERQMKERTDAAIKRQKEEADERAERKRALHEIDILVPQVLDVLRQGGYPGAKLIRVKERWGIKERAGWRVGSRQVSRHDSYEDNICYLLSTGKFNYGGDNNPAESIERITQMDPREVLAGLRDLMQKLIT